MPSIVENDYNFASLSIHDLLEARDIYHFHLMSKDNVVGTAIGLYLIRKDEAWPQARGEGHRPVKKLDYPRTLDNSEVRDYSWPCVLVFVRHWETIEDFRQKPSQIVPKTLYMPDGKAVPVCVIRVDEVSGVNEAAVPQTIRPQGKLGGGLPIIVDVQGQRHMATAGCLVTDGNLVYVLTARHACGEAGTPINSQLRDGLVRIGETADRRLMRVPFSDVYPAFPGRQSFLTLDVGLIRLDDVNDWTSNLHGLPPVQPMADFYEQNLSLKLIDHPVIASGAASGVLGGTIKALFYRYRSIGGYDYVGDYLIAPVAGGPNTRHGDSGAVWHLDLTEKARNGLALPLAARDLRPLAVEWGGQTFDVGGQRSNFAVATSLSNICKLLDVELLVDHERSVSGYWGRTGHYSIATLAINQLAEGALKQLLAENADLLSFDLATVAEKDFSTKDARAEYARLADVPDDVWKKSRHQPGGRDTAVRTGPEHPNHYADIDIAYGPGGESLRSLILAQPDTYLTVVAWQHYYRDLAAKADTEGKGDAARHARDPFGQGLLPFRIWQIFDDMVEFVRSGDMAAFVTAAGILAHYVGDASQPLHGSALADGDPSRLVVDEKTGNQVSFGKGVHSAFESEMLDIMAATNQLLPAIGRHLPAGNHDLPLVSRGAEAALACVRLMDEVAGILPPMTIIDAFEAVGGRGTTKQSTRVALWQKVGDETAEVIASGVRYLAMIWESAWHAGNGDASDPVSRRAFSMDELRPLYDRNDFLQSYTLGDIGPHLGLPTLTEVEAPLPAEEVSTLLAEDPTRSDGVRKRKKKKD